MDNDRQNPLKSPAVMALWRKAGVDFDRGAKSTLAQLLELGGYFPLSKVKDRLPMSRNTLHQWARENGDLQLTAASCRSGPREGEGPSRSWWTWFGSMPTCRPRSRAGSLLSPLNSNPRA